MFYEMEFTMSLTDQPDPAARVTPAEVIEAALHAIEAGRADVAHRYLAEALAEEEAQR